MKYGLFASPQQDNRTLTCNEVKCYPNLNEQERNSLIYYLKVEQGFNLGSRLSIIPLLIFLYQKNYFEAKVSIWRRELPLLAGCLAFIGVMDRLGSDIMWSNNERIIRKYKQFQDKSTKQLLNSIQKNQEIIQDQSEEDLFEEQK